MKKLILIAIATIISLGSTAQTFKWKELAELNNMTSAEQASWLEDEKNFVLIDTAEGLLTYADTSSSLDEELVISDSVVCYFWNYQFNPEISTTKGTDLIMSKALSRNFKSTWVEEEKDESGNVTSDALCRIKYGQLLMLGGFYDEKGNEVMEYASAGLFE